MAAVQTPPWAHNSDSAWPPTRFAERHCQWSRGLQALHTLVMAGLPSWAPHPRGWAWPARVHRHQLCGEFSPSSPCCLPPPQALCPSPPPRLSLRRLQASLLAPGVWGDGLHSWSLTLSLNYVIHN